MSVRPEDILPDDVSAVEINGIITRKGTVAAALANAKILASNDKTDNEKKKAKEMIRELAPMLVALELHQHVTWKNPEIQKIIDETL